MTKLTEVYEHLDEMQKFDLLAYLLDRVEVRPAMDGKEVIGTEITIALLREGAGRGQVRKRG